MSSSKPILRSSNLLKKLLFSTISSPTPPITHPITSISNFSEHQSCKRFSTIVPNPKKSPSSTNQSPSPLSSSTSDISSSFDFVPRSAREKRLSRVWWFLVALNFGIAGYLFTKPKKKDAPSTPAAIAAASVPEKPSTEPESGWTQPRG
ncbi:hypothetical protein ACHQM5_011879 [Ranunculus cassubicifolius]